MKSLIKKSFIFIVAIVTCLAGLPAEAGSDTYAGLFGSKAASVLTTASVAAAPAAAAVAATSVASAVGIGLGTAIAMPLIGVGLGFGCLFLKAKFETTFSSYRGTGAIGVEGIAACVGGFIIGAACSPLVAGLLTTGAVPSLVAVGTDVALKCAAISGKYLYDRTQITNRLPSSDKWRDIMNKNEKKGADKTAALCTVASLVCGLVAAGVVLATKATMSGSLNINLG